MHDLFSRHWQIRTLRNQQNYIIRFGIWQRGTQTPSRWIVFNNGRDEWIEKYDFLPELLGLDSETGFLTWDHRGQGGSGGTRAHIDHYESYTKDAKELVSSIVGEKPYIIIAHSMGGLIALRATMFSQLSPEGLILTSPLLLMRNTPIRRPIAKRLAGLVAVGPLSEISSGVKPHDNQFRDNPLTHCVAGFERIRTSPYKLPSPTFGWINATFLAQEEVFQPYLLQQLTLPIAIFAAGKETVVEQKGPSLWAQKAKDLNATVLYENIPEGRHELLNEIPSIRDPLVFKMSKLAKSWF